MGAWIEIASIQIDSIRSDVAPFMGAWIEMQHRRGLTKKCLSLPSWERGLKSPIINHHCFDMRSLPSWVRGLKSSVPVLLCVGSGSLPSWERGLKFSYLIGCILIAGVAPFMGAWIEIFSDAPSLCPWSIVAPFMGAWIEIPAMYIADTY